MISTHAQITDLFHQYREELMRRLLGMMKCRETVADLVQDTYLRLLHIADTQAVEQPRALLHRIAANLAFDHLRRDKHPAHAADRLDVALAVPCQALSQSERCLVKNGFVLSYRQSNSCPPNPCSLPALPSVRLLASRDRGTDE